MEAILDRIIGQQLTIDKLLTKGFFGSKVQLDTHEGTVGIIEIVYQKADCTIGFVDYPDESIGKAYEMPTHIHDNSIQVIQVVRKSVLMKITHRDYPHKIMERIMNEGDVCVIKPFEEHKTVPLEAGAKIAFINVPCDVHFKAYQGESGVK